MITATAILRGTITATAVIFSTQVGSCAAATVTVNSSPFSTVASGGTLNVPVKNNIGTLIGSLFSGFWRVANSQVNIENSDASFSASQAVVAEGLATYNLADTTYVFQINGVNQNSVTVPSMIDYTFDINFV